MLETLDFAFSYRQYTNRFIFRFILMLIDSQTELYEHIITLEYSILKNYGRFANESFRQLSVRQRPGSIRQRSYVTS